MASSSSNFQKLEVGLEKASLDPLRGEEDGEVSWLDAAATQRLGPAFIRRFEPTSISNFNRHVLLSVVTSKFNFHLPKLSYPDRPVITVRYTST